MEKILSEIHGALWDWRFWRHYWEDSENAPKDMKRLDNAIRGAIRAGIEQIEG